MYKIIYLITGEEVIKPINPRSGRPMTIKAARRYLKSNKSYTVRHLQSDTIYFTTEPEFQDTSTRYSADITERFGRVKVPKYMISIMRVKDV